MQGKATARMATSCILMRLFPNSIQSFTCAEEMLIEVKTHQEGLKISAIWWCGKEGWGAYTMSAGHFLFVPHTWCMHMR